MYDDVHENTLKKAMQLVEYYKDDQQLYKHSLYVIHTHTKCKMSWNDSQCLDHTFSGMMFEPHSDSVRQIGCLLPSPHHR